MFDLVLELLRVLVEIPRIGFVGKPSDAPLHFEVNELEESYQNLSEEDKQWFEDCWREFCIIITRQNSLHRDAISLSHKLACRLRDELETGRQEAGDDDAERLREEIWDLLSELPGERLAEVLAYMRGLAGSE